MSREEFRRWQPHEAIPMRVEITGIRDEQEGLSVIVASEETREPVVKLVFQDFVAYRNINESFRLRTWNSSGDEGIVESSDHRRIVVAPMASGGE